MPEVLTKHPDVVKQVLTSAGAQCGTGAPQKILTRCPRDQFCALPGGEICVYAVGQVGEMTQLSRAELCQLSQSAPSTTPPATLQGRVAAVSMAPLLAVAVAFWLRRRVRAR